MLKTAYKQIGSDIVQHHKILLLIILSALFLRFWGIWNAACSDEYNEVFEALRVCAGHLNFERWGKRFYLYILSMEYCIYYVLGWIFNTFQSPIDFATKSVRDLTPLFMFGKITSAVFGTISILMTYMIGKVLLSRQVGLLAAVFLCLNVVHIEFSHYARVDATLCLVVLTAFYFLTKIFKADGTPVLKYYILAGIFSGIAFQNKVPSVILVIPFLFAHLVNFQDKKLLKAIMCKHIGCYTLFFILGLILGNPAILFAPIKFITSLLGLGKVYTTPLRETKSEHIGFVAYLIYFSRELGILFALFSAYSVCRAIFSRKNEDILLLTFMIPYYLLMGASWYMVSSSYMIPFMPFLYLLNAKYLISGVSKIGFSQKTSQKILVAISILLLLHPFTRVIRYEVSLSGKNTRVLAKEWIEKNIPFGSKILMDSGKSINSFAPEIAENKNSILRILSSKKQALNNKVLVDPTGMLDKNALLYYELLLTTAPEESYDITSTMFGLNLKPIEYYIQNHYHYFIISKTMKDSRSNEFFAQRSPEIAEFYKSLDIDKKIKLIKRIGPSVRSRGDTFYIYKVLNP